MKQIKVPTPRQLPSGNWFLQISVKGKRISVTEPTEKECIARAMAIKQDMLQPVDHSAAPTLTACIDHYIENRQNILSPSTIRGYRTVQKNRFQSYMNRPVNTLDASGWQKAVNLEAKTCSAKTLKNAWGFISSVIHDATGQRFEPSLPAVVSDPREFLDPDQVLVFLDAVKGTKYEIPALMALHSLRRSEILAVTWDAIDLDQKIIRVQGAVVPDEDNNMVRKKENKNAASRRVVPIVIPQLLDALKSAKAADLPVVSVSGSALLNGINRVCRNADLPEVGIHGLRHSFASLAYSLHLPEKITMRIGGWKDDATMKKIYTHIADKDLDQSAAKMAAFFNSANEITNEDQ